jgi:hypothetical protein
VFPRFGPYPFVGVPIDRTERIVSRPGTFLQSSLSRRRRGVCHR